MGSKQLQYFANMKLEMLWIDQGIDSSMDGIKLG